ncbi:MAG: ATP-dependent Clp protease proteolytic subunit [Spirochaetales bacterium]|nr:ATP-dependent Clp protease proteolytic subunit [Leptospiraceae bacterium]MCP5480925.1 ATP-dependent Clp protease proteolytic subunit [Spirochaetales bacterium]MCP5485305.1 ATP-dependent Clp protease proteolytic subunit [Spirochaetales bacterium]
MNPFEPSLSQQDEDTLKTPNPIRNRIEQKLLEQRKIYLWGAVEDRSARYIVERMLYLEAEEPGKDITLYINSPGGVITSGMAIYDTMQMISADVSTVCMGLAASMGALLLCGGAKGKRYAWPHSRIMIHQPLISGQIIAPAIDIKIQAEEIRKIRDQINRIIAEASNKSMEQVEMDTDRDYYLNAEEAKNYGIVDHVSTSV